MPSTFWTQVD